MYELAAVSKEAAIVTLLSI